MKTEPNMLLSLFGCLFQFSKFATGIKTTAYSVLFSPSTTATRSALRPSLLHLRRARPALPPASIHMSPPPALTPPHLHAASFLARNTSAPLPTTCRPHVFEPPSPPLADCPSPAALGLSLLPPHILVASGACKIFLPPPAPHSKSPSPFPRIH